MDMKIDCKNYCTEQTVKKKVLTSNYEKPAMAVMM